jgi:hypothetical protein
MQVVCLLILLSISGCGNWRRQSVSHILLCDNPPTIDALALAVVMPNTSLSSNTEVVIGMSEESYTNMIINLHRIKAHLSQRIAVIEYYQSCIDQFKQQNI